MKNKQKTNICFQMLIKKKL